MVVSKNIEQSLRERLAQTEGGIKAAAALGGISERAAQKIMRFENVTQPTYDAFINGLDRLELAELQRRQENERKAVSKSLVA
ncbi:hypothetical protein DYU11_11750 [Fibrisoma montanum]|uniref:Uncharacterized protein n=1 Tax=Fibrisoma montanum TaxID=2305895 RepID=A0A418MBA7_9BACT|nr:hypothetical protein [Fibrisoma montanum]RIV23648.1 hypothetical protein DYU11_11750 [Fibrisoma montanum]